VLTKAENREYRSMDWNRYGRQDNEALVAEIRMLRAEVKELRGDQEEQTKEIVGSNFAANKAAADQVVAGQVNAASIAASRERFALRKE
jgi:hypothetical protein